MVSSYGDLPSSVRKTVENNLKNYAMNTSIVKNTISQAQKMGENLLDQANQWVAERMGSCGSCGSAGSYGSGSQINYDALVQEYMNNAGSGSGANYGFGIGLHSIALTASMGGLSGSVSMNYNLSLNDPNFIDFSQLKMTGSFKGERNSVNGSIKYDLGNGNYYIDFSSKYEDPKNNITVSANTGYSNTTGVYMSCSFKMTL
ncbi:hypothetical protein IJD34_03370 [bacterium]|nr:hypothetical protein [bacterium]